ncbi:MAG: hypothetical protein A2161_07900 [Candidatus Schekmanbacteria bacterium RBG_13_48_7]|uniref:DUF1015 domain-containing protein n=1 Tax=Candidatus Schekmanbacteria bacterium RBG_13_48_7 TaxID=1817878 RepID=A0A1F7RHS3_9BACT|nr:MAG: hypothetical protein A2161_07900 [Candidatus Schekmanbacteria bacterium RBG_13_48_7]
MITIKAFKGVRPDKEFALKVASPPYDVVNSEEAREIAKDNLFCFLHVVKPEIDLDPNLNPYDERVYQKGKENLYSLIKKGILVQDKEDHLYIYRQKMGDHVQTGIVACSSADDYMEDRIKKHELTREVKEKDRIKHVYTLNANTGPVFLTYKAINKIDKIVAEAVKNKPVYDFVSDDGVKHTFWVIENKITIDQLINEFSKIDRVYVADGHHRSASAAKVRDVKKAENPDHSGNEEYNYFLSVLFPHNQLAIMPYNRVVKDLNGMTKNVYLEKISTNFEIVEKGLKKPSAKHFICMYLDGQWMTLKAKSSIIMEKDPVKSLDVSILQDNLLTPVLGIGDPRKDDRIDFIGGIRGTDELEKLVNSRKFAIAFSMYPTSVEQLIAIADAGKLMPPKSTWFEPKLKSGLVIHLLD